MKIFYRLLIACTLLTSGSMAVAQVNLANINIPYVEHFESLAVTPTSTYVPQGWRFLETGTGANTTYAASTGSANGGNTYSFGLDQDRALGGVQSGSLMSTIGAHFKNNTGAIITGLQISYKGEQWRLGTLARGADRLDFQYSFDATSLNTGSWIDNDSLDFISPVTTGAVGALNGNTTPNNTLIKFIITGTVIRPDESFWIRWQDFNVSGADDGLAIDDFSIIPLGAPSNDPNIILTPTALNFGDQDLGQGDTLGFNIIGRNLKDSIRINSSNPAYKLSFQNSPFSSSLTLPESGGRVSVRFVPVTNGPVVASIILTSDSAHASLTVRGNGYDPNANIITIAEARTKPVGTKVTIVGRVTVSNQFNGPSFMEDSYSGIPVFDYGFSHAVNMGDSVRVTGQIVLFNEQVQIGGSGVTFFIEPPPALPKTPKRIQINELAAYEGRLVTIEQIQLVNNQFVFYPQSTERMIVSGIQADLRIDGDTNIPGLLKPHGVFDITGVVGRFKANAQLMPRFQSDIPGAIEPTTAYDSVPKEKTFDLVNWNIEFFGATKEAYGQEFGPENEALQRLNVKTVLESLDADVIAVQEVSDENLFNELTKDLSPYKSICTDRYSYSFNGNDSSFPPQKVCFLYDSTTVKVISARPLFEALYDSARTTDGSAIPGYPGGSASSFWSSGRLPFMLTAEVTIDGVTEIVKFINIHAKSGSAADDRARRLYDGAVLKDSLDAHFPNDNFVVLGDFNDDLDQSITPGLSSPYQNFVSDVTDYKPITKALSDAGARSTLSFGDVIDHQILSNELGDKYLAGSVSVIIPFRTTPNYSATTSDHLPVSSRFHFAAPRLSFVQNAITTGEGTTAISVSLYFSKTLTTDKTISISLGASSLTYGVDYVTSPAAFSNKIDLHALAGTDTLSFIITVTDDQIDELTESVFFELIAQQGIEFGFSKLLLTIEDNDVPTISFAIASASIPESSSPYEVILNLSQAPATDQSVTIALSRMTSTFYGQDFTTTPNGSSGQIVIPIDAGSTKKSFTFNALADNVRENTQEGVKFTILDVSQGLTTGTQNVFNAGITDVNKKKFKFIVIPNPTFGIVYLVDTDFWEDYKGKVRVVLRKHTGEIIYNGSDTPAAVSEAVSAVLKQQCFGIYLLNVNADGENSAIRILKI